MIKKTCYICNNEATSSEHVPPKCLFPEIKDTKGINFKKNLITVPSCDLHNSKKSDDDEFLMLSLSGLIKNNIVGSFHQLTKANRSLKRKNVNFLSKQILRNHKYGKIPTTDGKYRLVSIGYPNVERLYKCLEHIAYGLYFHQFKEKFEGEVKVIMEFIDYKEDNRQTLKQFLKKRFILETELNDELQGENPEVFYYQFHRPDNYGIIALKTVFYGTAEAYFAFAKKGTEKPFDLINKLIEDGIKTTVRLDDEQFIFNKK